MKDITLNEALTLLDSCPMAMLLQDGDGRVRACNRAFTALTGTSTESITGSVQPDDLIAPLLGSGTVIHWITANGDERWLTVETVSIDDSPGSMARFYLDITEQMRLRKTCDALAGELSEQSIHDGHLPSLLSRNGILVSLEPLVARSRRYNSPLTIVTMGISSEPESARDQALLRTVAVLKDQTRWADLVGCNNAHDFILILQETSQDAALQLLEKLDERMESLNASSSDDSLQACYGITQCQKNDSAAELLERAESALAEARINDSGRSIAV
jgi:GGDEF domain-containing protein